MADNVNENNEYEKAYATSEVANLLDVGDSTLRKYCLALEKEGYRYIRDDNDNRVFTEHDVIALRQLQEMIRGRKTTIVTAASIVNKHFNSGDRTNRTGIVPLDFTRSSERYDALLNEMKSNKTAFDEYRAEQMAFNHALLEELKKQQEYIENSVKSRDEQLMAAVREMQEQRLLAVAAEDEKKKKPWWKFGR